MTSLEAALARSREMIEVALTEARRELAALETRRAELLALISQGEAALGGSPAQPGPPPQQQESMTLHQALVQILRETNRPMSARELADTVNERGLYRKRDGSPVEINQIHARANNYHAIFEKDGARIWLREASAMDSRPDSIQIFRDDDDGFFDWLSENPDGYFINSERNPKPRSLVLHRPSCPHYTGGERVNWTKDYIKFCSPSREDLEEWALNQVGGEVSRCRSCFS